MCAQMDNHQKNVLSHREFEVQAEVGSAICLPAHKKYTVRIQIADFFIDTKAPLESKASYCRWSHRFDAVKFRCPYRSVEELGRVYFYLMDGSSPICFWRGEAKDFVANRGPSFTWYPLKYDPSIGRAGAPQDAGLLQIKMSIVDCQRNPPISWQAYPAWKEKPPKRLTPKVLRCYIFQCRDLPSADSDGSTDPYILIRNAENEDIRTEKLKDTLNPIFFQTLDVRTQYYKKESGPPIVLDLYDSDMGLLDSTDDFLGRAVIQLADASVVDLSAGSDRETRNKPPTPKWHALRQGFEEGSPKSGEVLASFVMVDPDTKFNEKAEDVRLSKIVPTKDYSIDIHVLGMRELASFGLMPIRKAFIKF